MIDLDMPVDRRHADRREMTQPDLDGGKPEVVDRAVLETDLVVGRACDAGTTTEAMPMVPPANHGRRRRASASRRTTSDPIPVGYPNSLYQEIGDEIRVPSRQVEAVRRRRTPMRPAARPSLGPVPRSPSRADGARPSSWTGPGMRRDCAGLSARRSRAASTSLASWRRSGACKRHVHDIGVPRHGRTRGCR